MNNTRMYTEDGVWKARRAFQQGGVPGSLVATPTNQSLLNELESLKASALADAGYDETNTSHKLLDCRFRFKFMPGNTYQMEAMVNYRTGQTHVLPIFRKSYDTNITIPMLNAIGGGWSFEADPI